MGSLHARTCAWCHGPIPHGARRDAITCSKPCRQARHRVMRHAAAPRDSSGGGLRDVSRSSCTRRVAYADPPYPGKSARYYRDHPDFRGEVDHRALLEQLAGFDAWALSTSASALPELCALAVAQDLPVRVASWTKGERVNSGARFPLNAWEPVLYVPLPSRDAGSGPARRVDALVHGVTAMSTLPTRVIGTKPAAFVRWLLLELLGLEPQDQLVDLFPGSGIVTRLWELHQAAAVVPAGGCDAS
jgi:hypothetical protein